MSLLYFDKLEISSLLIFTFVRSILFHNKDRSILRNVQKGISILIFCTCISFVSNLINLNFIENGTRVDLSSTPFNMFFNWNSLNDFDRFNVLRFNVKSVRKRYSISIINHDHYADALISIKACTLFAFQYSVSLLPLNFSNYLPTLCLLRIKKKKNNRPRINRQLFSSFLLINSILKLKYRGS